MTPQLGEQTVSIRTLPSISRSKGIQTIEFGELMELNIIVIRNGNLVISPFLMTMVICKTIFLKNHTQNVVEKLISDPFMKN